MSRSILQHSRKQCALMTLSDSTFETPLLVLIALSAKNILVDEAHLWLPP